MNDKDRNFVEQRVGRAMEALRRVESACYVGNASTAIGLLRFADLCLHEAQMRLYVPMGIAVDNTRRGDKR